MRLSEKIEEFKGQKVAVMCVRYQYRGILSEVGENYIVLSNAAAVESSGPTQSDAPQQEDQINSSIIINSEAVELVYQPQWAFAPLANE